MKITKLFMILISIILTGNYNIKADNIDGCDVCEWGTRLKDEGFTGELPQGSYQKSCHTCYWSAEPHFYCTCRNLKRDWKLTGLLRRKYENCESKSFSNKDGSIICDQ